MKEKKLRDKINKQVNEVIEMNEWYNQPEFIAGLYVGAIIGELEILKKEIKEIKIKVNLNN
jgi:hypothetical protein